MSEIFEKESDYIKKIANHNNDYGYIDCPYCGCHHYLDNYVEPDNDDEPETFNLECDNCKIEFVVCWQPEFNKVEVYPKKDLMDKKEC